MILDLLNLLENTYGKELGRRCLPVAAKLLRVELSANPSVESMPDGTGRGALGELVKRQEVQDCFRAVQVANAFDKNKFDQFLDESKTYIHTRFNGLSESSLIHQENKDLSDRAYNISEARTFLSTKEAENAISIIISENYQFPRVCPVEDHFFREVCWKYSEHLNFDGPAVDVLKEVSVVNWKDYLWGHLMLQHKDAIRFLRGREVLRPSLYPGPRNMTAVGGDADKETTGEGDTDQETAGAPVPFAVNDSTTDQILNEEAFNQLCFGMTPIEKKRCLRQIITYYLSKTAYFDPDSFQWLKRHLSRSWGKLKSDYDEAQNTLRHEEDSKREARDKTHRLLTRLNELINYADDTEYLEKCEIRRIVFDGRRYFYNQNRAAQGERIAADPLKREILELINLVQLGNGDNDSLQNINILSINRFNSEIRNRPVFALEDRIYHINVLLPYAEAEMRNDLEKEMLKLNIKLAAFRHEDSRVHYLKYYGPGLESNLGRYRLHKRYLAENPGSRNDIIGGVLWVRGDREIFDILLENGLVVGEYIQNQPRINRSKRSGKELVGLMVFLPLIIQRRLDLFIDITEWDIIKLCFNKILESSPHYSWEERAECGYELKTEDQLLNIEWIVGRFRNRTFRLRLTTPGAIQLWRDYNIELSRNNENLELIADYLARNQR